MPAAADPASLAPVVEWYDRKTEWLLEKYGPGPRVHYHTGFIPPDEPAAPDLAGLSRQLVASQERLLRLATEAWDAPRLLSGDVLDAGCGLGGTAIFLAQEFGARVTGVTPVARHLDLMARFAEQAGVADRVRGELGDAHTVPGDGRFDAAVSIGASNYFNRFRWFQRLRGLLRPGGHVFLEDSFCLRPELAGPFNDYWLSDVGTPDEYLAAASEAGFDLVRRDDLTPGAAGFWRVTVDYSRRMLELPLSDAERAARHRSIAWITQLHEAHLDGGFLDLLLHFRRRD